LTLAINILQLDSVYFTKKCFRNVYRWLVLFSGQYVLSIYLSNLNFIKANVNISNYGFS